MDDFGLPKATISKVIKDYTPDDIKCSSDTRDLILDCSMEFVKHLATEASEICTKENKKTLAPEHILKALETLGYHDFIDDIRGCYEQHKTERAEKPKASKRLEELGIPEDELKAQQEALFAKARLSVSLNENQ